MPLGRRVAKFSWKVSADICAVETYTTNLPNINFIPKKCRLRIPLLTNLNLHDRAGGEEEHRSRSSSLKSRSIDSTWRARRVRLIARFRQCRSSSWPRTEKFRVTIWGNSRNFHTISSGQEPMVNFIIVLTCSFNVPTNALACNF